MRQISSDEPSRYFRLHPLAALLSAPVIAQQSPPKLSAEDVSPSQSPVPQHFTLKEAAQAAVLKSPEVQARWHAFREATEEIGVAEGGFFPRVDLIAATGHEKIVQKRAEICTTLRHAMCVSSVNSRPR